mgnify:CR=1 FL=1
MKNKLNQAHRRAVREIAQADYHKLKKQLLSGIRRNRLLTAVGIVVMLFMLTTVAVMGTIFKKELNSKDMRIKHLEEQLKEKVRIETVMRQYPKMTMEMFYHIQEECERYGVPVNAIFALIDSESNWNQSARSRVGAIGLMQLMPETAEGLGVNPYDWKENISGGVKHFRYCLDKSDGYLSIAYMKYNCGTNRERIPEESKRYARNCTQKYIMSEQIMVMI